MSAHDQHTSFIKTPQQLIVVILLAFAVPIATVLLVIKLVLSQPSADAGALAPEAVAARIQPIGRVEFGAASGSGGGAMSGEEIVKTTCAACHQAGVAGAPKLGNQADWAPRIKLGMSALVASVVKGKGAMPPRAGNASLSDQDLARAVTFMANQAGAKFKEPAAAQKKSK